MNFEESFARIRQWMKESNVPAEALGPPATKEEEADFAERLGFPTPEGLRVLWSFARTVPWDALGGRDLFTPTTQVDPKENVQLWLEDARDHALPDDEDDTEPRAEALEAMGIRREELESDEWCELAYTTLKDLVVVNGKTGRVFWAGMDFCRLKFLASSVEEWLSDCVERYCIDPPEF